MFKYNNNILKTIKNVCKGKKHIKLTIGVFQMGKKIFEFLMKKMKSKMRTTFMKLLQ